MGGRVPGGLWIIAGKENLGLIQRQIVLLIKATAAEARGGLDPAPSGGGQAWSDSRADATVPLARVALGLLSGGSCSPGLCVGRLRGTSSHTPAPSPS